MVVQEKFIKLHDSVEIKIELDDDIGGGYGIRDCDSGDCVIFDDQEVAELTFDFIKDGRTLTVIFGWDGF